MGEYSKINIMKIGNWNIIDSTIEFDSDDENKFVIERKDLLETIDIEESDDKLYKWIVLATAAEYLSIDDLYDLNFAFVYAAGDSGNNDFDYELFDKTVEYQFEMIDEEEPESNSN